MPGPLLVVDAPHALYRAFFGLPDKVRHRALHGSVLQVLRVVDERDPRAVVMAFGPDSADYRTAAFPAYHAHRPPMPDDLATDWALARDLYRALGWIVADTDTLEADDVMHAYALAEQGPVLILTGDRDMFQCVTGDVRVLLQGRGETTEMGRAEVVERYGILPEQVPDFIALRGDPSDGIPGAKGIGEKGAADLLRRHGTLDAAIAAAVRESKPTVRRALIEQADELRMFRDLATLRNPGAERPPDTPTDREAGAAAAEALGLGGLASRIAGRATF